MQVSAAMRRKVFERAKWRCERCGAHYPLELHHINGQVIAVLCVECHTKIDQAENARRRIGWRTER